MRDIQSMKELQSPFNKAQQYMTTPKSYTAPNNDITKANNKESSKSDSSVSKQTSDLNNHQADNKAQDTNIDNSQMSLNDQDAQKKATPKEDTSSFSLTDYFKKKAREKMMNQISSSTQDNPDAAQQPADNSPSATNPKKSPKLSPPNNTLAPPVPNKAEPKFAQSKMPKFSMPKANISIPKPRMR